MNEIIELLITASLAVIIFTALYKMLPFKKHEGIKPKLVFFPKYILSFNNTIDEIESSLTTLGFKKNIKGVFTRGKVYGDFSAKAIKLSVEVNEQTKEIKVYASFFGILFDTGDVWQVTADIVGKK